MGTHYDLRQVPPDELLAELKRLLAADCQRTAELLAHLAEVDARKLYLEHASSSMFSYCVDRLHMAEPTAYKRIAAGRMARRFPVLFEMVASGQLHLTAVTLLAPHLTEDNHRELLEAAVHKSKREIQRLLAARFPRPDVPTDVRKVPERHVTATPSSSPSPTPPAPAPPAPTQPPPSMAASARPASTPTAAPSRPFALTSPQPPPPQVSPLSQDRYYLKLTISAAVHDKLFEAQALLRHAIPSGDLDAVLGRALDLLLRDLRRGKFAQTSAPRPGATPPQEGSRHIPNEVKRQVVARDGCQCTFVDPSGHRCQERSLLEFHHLLPFARGGESVAENLTLRCRGHQAYAAAKDYGEQWMKRKVAAVTDARAGAGLQALGEESLRRKIAAAGDG